MPAESTWHWLIWVVAAYGVGSTPFGLILGRLRGVDIREHGSGNLGATNAGRVLGRDWGVVCFLLDVAKGLGPVLGYALLVGQGAGAVGALKWLAIGAAAVLGHIFPVWLRFKGGKGVATGLGVVLGFWPVLTIPGLIAAVIWVLVVRATGYVSAASMAAACALPPLALGSAIARGLGPGQIAVFVGVTVLLAALVVLRHRSNLTRLRRGEEPRAAWAKRSD